MMKHATMKAYVTRTWMDYPVRHGILKSPKWVLLNVVNFLHWNEVSTTHTLVRVSSVGHDYLGQSEESV